MKDRWKIPADWSWKTLGDIAEIFSGATPKANDPSNFDDTGIPWITPSDLTNYDSAYISRGARSLSVAGFNSCSAQLLPANSVLFSSRAPIGYCVIASQELCTNQGFKSLVLNEGILPRFVRHYMLHSKDYAESLASGTTFLELSATRIKEMRIPIPPFEKQELIADFLDRSHSLISTSEDALSDIPTLLERFRQSVLASAFRGDLTAEWREQNPDVEPASELLKRIRAERKRLWIEDYARKLADRARTNAQKKNKTFTDKDWQKYYDKKLKAGALKYEEPEPVDAEAEGLPELPPTWEWVRLEALSTGAQYDITDGPFGSKLKTIHYVEESPDTAQVITLGNLGVGELKNAERYFVPLAKYEALEKHWVQAGDLLIAGMAEPVGRCCEAPDNISPALVKADCFKFSPSRLLVARWIMHYFNSPVGYTQCLKIAQGTGRLRINLTNTKGLPIPLAPKAEQEHACQLINTGMTRIQELSTHMETTSSSLESLQRSILASAFDGFEPSS